MLSRSFLGFDHLVTLYLGFYDRPVVQLVERRSPKPNVGGSSPSWPANKFF
jgi:hypothetical protein